jgi:3-oxoacyl-[acyl-carrier protein] reductase
MTSRKSLEGKVALVTGASGGIGGAIAVKLASEGASIGVHYNATKSNAEKICEDIRVAGGLGMPIQADVTDASQVQRMFDDLEGVYGPVDILVNNAGINKDGLLIRMSDSDWDEVIRVNLKGAFLCSRAAAKVMLKKRSGRIITISSIVGLVGNLGQANYAASKAGLIGLTKSLARELASRNVTVNALTPGFVEVGMVNSMTKEMKEMITARIPMGRLGSPEDVAALAGFLASEEAGYITGQAFSVDGGLVL